MRIDLSLRDLRTAKGITQKQLAIVLKMSASMYSSIEAGHRKPTIDTLYTMASLYGTSMEFIYGAFYRQHVVYHAPDRALEYALERSKLTDLNYLRKRYPPPHKQPVLPAAVIVERERDALEGLTITG